MILLIFFFFFLVFFRSCQFRCVERERERFLFSACSSPRVSHILLFLSRSVLAPCRCKASKPSPLCTIWFISEQQGKCNQRQACVFFLLKFVLFCVCSEENSTAALLWLRTELSLVAGRSIVCQENCVGSDLFVADVPVLIAVDDANSLFNPSSYYDMDHPSFAPTLLHPSKLSGSCKRGKRK